MTQTSADSRLKLADKRKQLKSRSSALQLMQLSKSGQLDARSEVGKVINLEEWAARPDTLFHCRCTHVKDNEQLIASHLLLTDTYLYILRATEDEREFVIKARRTLTTIMKITTKAKMPELVKLQYGSKGPDGVHVTDTDRLEVTKDAAVLIKKIKKILQKV